MVDFYVLPIHASQALGIRPDALDLPCCGYGVSGDALWVDPRFQEIRRVRAAVAAQMADRRFDIRPDLHHKPRSPDEVEATLKRTRERRYARKKRQRKAKSKRASVI